MITELSTSQFLRQRPVGAHLKRIASLDDLHEHIHYTRECARKYARGRRLSRGRVEKPRGGRPVNKPRFVKRSQSGPYVSEDSNNVPRGRSGRKQKMKRGDIS